MALTKSINSDLTEIFFSASLSRKLSAAAYSQLILAQQDITLDAEKRLIVKRLLHGVKRGLLRVN